MPQRKIHHTERTANPCGRIKKVDHTVRTIPKRPKSKHNRTKHSSKNCHYIISRKPKLQHAGNRKIRQRNQTMSQREHPTAMCKNLKIKKPCSENAINQRC